MDAALTQAELAAGWGDVPVGAVVVSAEGEVVGVGANQREKSHDPTGHAEILALRQAGETLGSWNLEGCTLVVTLEPCTMCAGAIVNSRIKRVVFGAWEPKTGAAGSIRDVLRDSRLSQEVEVISGVGAKRSAALLEQFFASRRD